MRHRLNWRDRTWRRRLTPNLRGDAATMNASRLGGRQHLFATRRNSGHLRQAVFNRTTSTEHAALRATISVTLPRSRRGRPVRPTVPTTINSAWI